MQDTGNTLKRLGFYYLLLAIEIIFTSELVPNVFPFRNISSLILIAYSVCLYFYYSYRITGGTGTKMLIEGIAVMLIALALLRGLKYSVFTETGYQARHIWYLYYVPLLLIPAFFFLASIFIHSKDSDKILLRWGWVLVVSVAFIILILTNDSYQLIFRFRPGFANWDSDYSRGILFYVSAGWQYFLYLAGGFILVYNCHLRSSLKQAWIILIPFLLGTAALVLLAIDEMPKFFGTNIIQLHESVGFMIACMLECCLQLGLIPTNENYRGLMRITSVAALIADKNGNIVYKSENSADMTPSQLASEDKTMLDANTVLRKMEFSGGYGYWQEDVTDINIINSQLEEAKERLTEETEIIRLKTELRQKQMKLRHRTRLYDEIARMTEQQSLKISELAEAGLHTSDADKRKQIERQIVFYGAYIKRYANFRLLSNINDVMNVTELVLAVAESLRYLNLQGIPGEIMSDARSEINASYVMTLYFAFETLIEDNMEDLSGVYVNLSDVNEAVRFKLTLEGVYADVPRDVGRMLAICGISASEEYEDNTTYICFEARRAGGLT